MSRPRAHTRPEMREMLLGYLRTMAEYWSRVDFSGPEFAAERAKKSETQMRLEGLGFSLLTMIDGGSTALPAFKLVPHPHRSDRKFCIEQGSNWWPKDVDIAAGAQLHELWNGWPDPEK